MQRGLNFTQSCLRPEIARSQSQNQSPIANGYLQGHLAFQARQNETNFLGVDTASRCLTALDSQMGNGPDLHKKNSPRFESTESPINYDFFGGQQQISAQNSGMIQPLPRQQSGMTDMQLLQQHSLLKQMQEEFQRQQLPKPQFQLPDDWQVSSVVKQGLGSLSPALINGVPVYDASNYSWQHEQMAPNANLLQHGASPAMQGSSGGVMFSPEQGQVHLMGMVPQQVDQSFYGISTVGGRGNPYPYASVQMDKPLMQQAPASNNSFPGNQCAMFSDQFGLQDGTSVSRQGDRGKNVFGAAAGQGLNNGFHSENLQQMTIQPKNAVMQESCGRPEHPDPSEISREKSVMQAAPSQSVATLDATEEKILFGSDDSVWDIFGRSTNMGSMLDGTESFGAFVSLQSGSWSALMQSAVAETSSIDLGVREEWSGLGVQSSEPLSGNMPSQIVNDDNKQQLAFADNLQIASTLNSKPVPMSTDANINHDFFSVPGVQQSGIQIANEQTGRMHNNSSQRFFQLVTEERSKWLDCSSLQKPVAESAQPLGNVARSPHVEVSAKSISGHQQGMAVYNSHVHPHNKSNGWSYIESASCSGHAISKSQVIDSALQPSQNIDHRGALYEERGPGSALDHPVPDANIERGNVKPGLGSPKVTREGYDPDNVATITDSRTTRVTKESNQQLPNSHNLNPWRNIDSKVNSELSKVPAKYQQNHDKSPQTFDSSGSNCLDKGASKANILENPSIKETSNDKFHPKSSQHSSTGAMKDNVWLDVNDLQGGKLKSSVHAGCKPSGTRKFQYHPMGDLDVEVEPSYGAKSVTHLQLTSQHVSQGLKGQGHFGQSKFSGHATGESTETEKGCFPGIQVDEVPSKSSNQGSASDRSFVGFAPNKTAPMSQSMLELLPKVDQPRDHGTETHLCSSEHNLSSEMPDAETSDGSVGQFHHNRVSASQGFGLQLGLPSQRFTILDRAISSQSSPRGADSLNTVHVSSEGGRKGHTWLGQSPTYGASHGDIRNNVSSVSGQTSNKAPQYNIQGNFSAGFTSDYPYLKSHLQSQNITSVGSQVTPNQSINVPFGGLASLSKQTDDSSERAQASQLGRKSAPRVPRTAADNDLASSEISWPSSSNQIHARDPGEQYPVLACQPSATSETPKQGAFTKVPDVWTSVSAPQQLLGAQSSRASENLFKPHHQSHINSETTLPGRKKLDDQIAQAGGSGQSELPAGSAKPQKEQQPAKAQPVLPENDASSNPATVHRDIEAFGHTLRPNNAVHQNHSLLHQVQSMKYIESEPSNRSVKRFKGPNPDSGLDTQEVSSEGAEQLSCASDTMMKDAPVNRRFVPSGDSNMLSFSSNTGDNREAHSSSNDILAFAQNDSQHFSDANKSAANLRGGHSQISPQMAPSWFDRYGTFKNGQLPPLYDARKIAMMKAAEKAFLVGRPSGSLRALHSNEQADAAADASQLDNAQKSSNLMQMASEHISPLLLPSDITNQNLAVVRTRKRKSMAFELLPWHSEVTQVSQRSENISSAEAEWAHAANRLIEKVEDKPEMIEEDWPPVVRSKRRLISTMQLIQQLLRAPPRAVFSADASKNYEAVAYFVARSVLGDACSRADIPESDTAVPSGSGSTLSEKLKKERNQSTLKAAEDFVIRAMKLENDLQSLDKKASILDLRLECQDLEKISVINRFAKFHCRGQGDGAETSSSSDAIAGSHKFFPQRYVTALPMPRNLPDRDQCLSL